MPKSLWSSLLLALIVCVFPANAFSQSITLNLSTNSVADADEYFTDVLGSRKDFNSNCDVGNDGSYYNPETISSGVWTGTNPELANPFFNPLPTTQSGTLSVFIEDCYKFGDRHPLDASKYDHVSWSQAVSAAAPGTFNLLWANDGSAATSGLNDLVSYFLPSPFQGTLVDAGANQLVIKTYNVPNSGPSIPWSGNITNITLRPSDQIGTGGSNSMDWFRVFDGDDSPTVTFTWNSTGDNGDDYVRVFVDTDNTLGGGRVVEVNAASDGNASFKTGQLPPGTYYFYAELTTGNSQTVKARSTFQGPFTINGKPTLQFTAPSRINPNTSNQLEYFRDVTGDEADFSQTTDVKNLRDSDGNFTDVSTRGWEEHSFEDGLFIATSQEDTASVTVDTQVHLNVPSNQPINPQTYRWFCHKMQVDSTDFPRNGNASEVNDAGWVMRVVWAANGAGTEGRSDDHFIIEKNSTFPSSGNSYTRDGFTTYCIDLWDDNTLDPVGATDLTNTAWRDMDFVSILRHDPLESTPATRFALDHVWLTSPNFTDSNSNFVISWNSADPESDLLTVTLGYDSDNSGFNGTTITTLNNQAPGSGSYTWDASGVAAGEYYIYGIVSDGTNTNRFYSDVTVKVNQTALASKQPRRAPFDYDGDGKTDPTVVRTGANNAATWYQYLTRTSSLNTVALGDTRLDMFYDLDTDGDRIADEYLVRTLIEPNITWLGFRTHNTTVHQTWWGLRTSQDIPIATDFNGDGADDITVWRPSTGDWFSIYLDGSTGQQNWGQSAHLPSAEDFDGDGISDLGAFIPEYGYWYVRLSTNNYSILADQSVFRSWGLPGDDPMPGDYSGDGKADLVVWRGEPFSIWWICPSDDNFSCDGLDLDTFEYIQFGLPTDLPIRGDFDGDGKLDLAVWRESNGTWYWRRSSDLQVGTLQWGIPGDQPIGQGIKSVIDRLN